MKTPIISRIVNLFETRQDRSDLLNPKQWLLDALGIRTTKTGIKVTKESAMRNSAVYGCVRIISETIASLPLFVYERIKNGKNKAIDHPLFYILHDKPNKDMTSFTHRETMLAHLLLWGNYYSQIIKNRLEEIKTLYPFLPDKIKVEVKNNEVIYRYKNKLVKNEDILHIPGLSFNGIIGKSPIGYAREAIGLGLALEQFGAEFFSSGTNISGVVEHPKSLSPKAYKNLADSLREKYAGLGKTHRLMLLEEGMKFAKTTIPPEDSQFIESRKYQVEDIARIFRVPLHLLQNLDKATFANIEHQSIDFVVHTIRPWLVRIEQAINTKLFNEKEIGKYFAEFKVDGLLRGDTLARYQSYHSARMDGWLSADDIRELENMNPLPDKQGEVYLVPLNMIDVKQVGKFTAGRTVIVKGEEIRILPKETESSIEIEREKRGIRSARTRKRLADSYKGLFENVITRLVKREKVDILKMAKKTLDKRDTQLFNEKLDQYYQKHRDFVRTHTRPVFNTYAEAISLEAAEEIGYDLKPKSQRLADDVRIDKFIEEYQDSFNARYTKENRARIREIIAKAISENKDPLEALEKEFNHWEEKKPQIVSNKETIKLAGAVSILIYTFAGITKLIWRNTGRKTCVYCQSLDGKVVGINETFIPKGVDYSPEGADGSMKITGPRIHPPLHLGCVCMITAG